MTASEVGTRLAAPRGSLGVGVFVGCGGVAGPGVRRGTSRRAPFFALRLTTRVP